jgi:hypothetical protein
MRKKEKVSREKDQESQQKVAAGFSLRKEKFVSNKERTLKGAATFSIIH